MKDKAVHAVIFDKALQERLNKDVQSYRLITVAVLVDRLKINGSLARKALNDLEAQGTIKKVVGHNTCNIYSTLDPGQYNARTEDRRTNGDSQLAPSRMPSRRFGTSA